MPIVQSYTRLIAWYGIYLFQTSIEDSIVTNQINLFSQLDLLVFLVILMFFVYQQIFMFLAKWKFNIYSYRWEFKTDDYDIGFSVVKRQGKGLVSVVPMTRTNSHVVTQDGSYTCPEPGTCNNYVLKLSIFIIYGIKVKYNNILLKDRSVALSKLMCCLNTNI